MKGWKRGSRPGYYYHPDGSAIERMTGPEWIELRPECKRQGFCWVLWQWGRDCEPFERLEQAKAAHRRRAA